MAVRESQVKKLSKKGRNAAQIGRELEASYWVVRRIILQNPKWSYDGDGEVAGHTEPTVETGHDGFFDDTPDIEPSVHIVPMSIRMINWELFIPYAVSLLENPHTSTEDKERVTTMLTEVASFLRSLSR